MRITLTVLALASSAGCYYYRPLETQTPAPETIIAVSLSDSGTDHLWRYLGPDVGSLRGRLLAVDDTTYTLSVYAVDLRHGTTLGWRGERVVVGRELVTGLSQRHFSLGRTTLAGGLSAAAFVLTLQAFKALGVGFGLGGGGGKPR